MKRSFEFTSIIVILALINVLSANASQTPSGSCTSLGQTKTVNGYKYTCIKAQRSLSNPLGKKFVWNKGEQIPNLEQARSTNERIAALNFLGFGNWKQVANQGFNGQVFMSGYPCRIFIANDLNSAIQYFNDKVNANAYGGFWLGIESQKWVIDQPSTYDKTCVQYFSRNYGGRIYNGNTQNYEY